MRPKFLPTLIVLLFAALAHLGIGAAPVLADDSSSNDGHEDSSSDSQSEDSSSDNSSTDDGSTDSGSSGEDQVESGDSQSSDSGLEGIESGHYQVEDQRSTRNAVGSSKALPLKDILAAFADQVGAQVVDVQLIRIRQFLLYQIKYVDSSGSVKLAYYYARSGIAVNLD